jgi:DNA-binding LacI/PurR family transcriptional regulator
VDGVVALGLHERHPELGSIRQAGLPVVVVDAPAWSGHGAILVDDEGGARQAADHVLALGHRDVLVMGVEPAVGEADDGGVAGRRLAGYRAAFRSAGVALPPERITRPPATIEGGEAAFVRAWSLGHRPTAVLCMSDAAAAGVLAAARRLGIRVPEELSIVGFDDLPLTRFTDPPLTTVHQPVRRKGEAAASMLLEALRRPPADDQDRVLVLETRLVVRRSTAVPSSDRSQEVVVAR